MNHLIKKRGGMGSILRSVWLAAPLAAAPVLAQAQGDPAASLLAALSLVSNGLLVAPVSEPEVTRDGDRFHVHIPLPALASPDASIEVAAKPRDSGAWEITDLTLPRTGEFRPAAGKAAGAVRFSIGQQTAHGRIDPTLTAPSPYAIALSDVALHFDNAATPAELRVGQVTLDGTLTGADGGRMNVRSHSQADNWQFGMTSKAGGPVAASLRRLNVQYDVDGLDRARADRLRAAFRAIGEARRDHAAPDLKGPVAPWRALVDAGDGLLSGLRLQETWQGLHFEGPRGNTGDINEVRLGVRSEVTGDSVSAHVDVGVHGMALATVPAQFAAYMPQQVGFTTMLAGIPSEALRHLLREATAPGADPAALQRQAIALLAEPGAQAGIDSLLVESGPLTVRGSARVRPLPDGTAGLDIHLTAHGMDAMLARLQADPQVRNVMPVLFLAKGLGKPDGDGLVWDIELAHGHARVNGVPMGGQPDDRK
jgi:hypothetical protein